MRGQRNFNGDMDLYVGVCVWLRDERERTEETFIVITDNQDDITV